MYRNHELSDGRSHNIVKQLTSTEKSKTSAVIKKKPRGQAQDSPGGRNE